jgi:pimeloyl-ACP methyl ester carboxylesterase
LLYYTETGPADAPVIVFLHGGGVSGWSWKPQASRLTEYRCIVPDLPGHGQSPADGSITINDSSEKIAELIKDRAPGRRVNVVGLSIGGQIALQLMSTRPELVDRVIVSGANTSPSGSIRLLAPLLKLIMILYSPIQNTGYMIHANMKQLRIPPKYEAEVRADTKRITPDIYTQVAVESMTFPLPPLDDAARLLVACGEQEHELVKKSARMMREAHPGIRCVTAPGVGHNWGIEKPELFTSMIRAWLEEKPLPPELEPLP